jgi:GNAT acetyltransferase-like protein/acetyltransferase (GNAT) family protein
MASTEVLPLAALTETDIAGCMALSAEAGWNQTPDDWALFMRHGTVFGLPADDGRPVATGAILPFAEKFAWISMVLVTAARRRGRIGTGILETCCAELRRRGLVAVLDATPAGERVYRPLGFAPMFALTRWQGQGGGAPPPAGIRPMQADDLAAAIAIDARVFGAPRDFLLRSFFARAPQLAFITADGAGFALARPGRIATQIGPIIAADENAAAALLRAALGAVAGPVFLDVADRWQELGALLNERGFTVQRPFLRMALGRSAPFGDIDRTFVVAGPEFG